MGKKSLIAVDYGLFKYSIILLQQKEPKLVVSPTKISTLNKEGLKVTEKL